MTDTDIATVGDLIAALHQYDPATPVRLATQPGYPLENLLARVACTPDDAEYALETAYATVEGLASHGYDLTAWLSTKDVTLAWRRRP